MLPWRTAATPTRCRQHRASAMHDLQARARHGDARDHIVVCGVACPCVSCSLQATSFSSLQYLDLAVDGASASAFGRSGWARARAKTSLGHGLVETSMSQWELKIAAKHTSSTSSRPTRCAAASRLACSMGSVQTKAQGPRPVSDSLGLSLLAISLARRSLPASCNPSSCHSPRV